MSTTTPHHRITWVASSGGDLRGFHLSCAHWLGVQPSREHRGAAITEICHGCGVYITEPPPKRQRRSGPILDSEQLLGS